MERINCNVINCSHNNSHICYADKIFINGEKAHKDRHTCCSSFLDESIYSNLSSNVNNRNCEELVCTVKNCKYNKDGSLCTLDNILVAPETDRVNLYIETCCSSFECK